MNRRHFLSHLIATSTTVASANYLTNSILANQTTLKKNSKSAILLWMGGGPSTIDLWDLKPGSTTGGPFKPINTNVDGIQICEHLPLLAKNMDKLSIVRSMSTREADHNRGRYYMHTGYVPSPTVDYPSYGSVISHELINQIPQLDIPPFVSIGGSSVGAGFLGMTYAPFVVDSNGNIRDLNMGIDPNRLSQRLQMLKIIEDQFISQNRGEIGNEHSKVLNKTVKLMTSPQMEAFKVNKEKPEIKERYGNTGFGRGCLMARRLVEIGVPFVEVDLGGWDNHSNIFPTLQNNKLPELDKAMSALLEDLDQRGLLQNTSIIWMGEFGRTPNINGSSGRDHWARSWSVVVGGGGFKTGQIIGQTSNDGKEVITESYTSEDLFASVLKSLEISTETTFTAKNGRPMKIANSGKIIKELFSV
jgi:uncharacterized protein (DUF1501 family)